MADHAEFGSGRLRARGTPRRCCRTPSSRTATALIGARWRWCVRGSGRGVPVHALVPRSPGRANALQRLPERAQSVAGGWLSRPREIAGLPRTATAPGGGRSLGSKPWEDSQLADCHGVTAPGTAGWWQDSGVNTLETATDRRARVAGGKAVNVGGPGSRPGQRSRSGMSAGVAFHDFSAHPLWLVSRRLRALTGGARSRDSHGRQASVVLRAT